ncbi:MAG: tetratricopeptide repeat protein, partial [Gallionella sp.]|nr:tetratricopeptide repeat protein [Gallionella sp.]
IMTNKPGRNDDCPCGSGKKYKKCCALNESAQAAQPAFNRSAIPQAMQLAVQHHNAGRLPEAEALYRQILSVQPNHADALHLSGLIINQWGEKEIAVQMINQAIKSSPRQYSYHNSLGIVLSGQGKQSEAVAAFRKALSLNPDFVAGHRNLGKVFYDLGNMAEAIPCFKKSLALDSASVETHNDLANAYAAQGKFSEAIASFQKALSIKPDYADAYNNLGVVYKNQDLRAEAIVCFQKAIAFKPTYAEAYNNLGNTLKTVGKFSDAVACLQQAVTLKPTYAEAYSNLGSALQDQGRLGMAAASFQQALAIQPELHQALSNWCFVVNYAAGVTPNVAVVEAARYGAMVRRKAGQAYSSWRCEMQPQRLRIGLVSGDFRAHPVAYFLQGLLEHCDPARIEIVAYPTNVQTDSFTQRLLPRFSAWKPLYGKNDPIAARQIHDDGIHILIDLSGYTNYNRLPMFCCKPAPVQATWLGYFGTTGVAEIDYLIGDPHVTPPEEQPHFVEKIWCLPETYLCFTPPDVEIKCNPLSALENGYITFGCFNHLTKMNDAVVALWAQVLNAVPSSRLFLKTKELFDEALRANTLARFASHGIGGERLILEANSPRAELLAAYHRVDIALDPFPYPGGTTSVEALWMGVPVLTKRGDRFLSHVGETVAHNAGLANWIAQDEQDYLAKAVTFAADLNGLAELRGNLRSQVLASPLYDAARFARHFEDAMWGMWHNYQNRQGSAS